MWPVPVRERERLFLDHEQGPNPASQSPDGFRLATCVVCERPMVSMWHLWVNREIVELPAMAKTVVVKELHMCHQCATDDYGAPEPDRIEYAPVVRPEEEFKGQKAGFVIVKGGLVPTAWEFE